VQPAPRVLEPAMQTTAAGLIMTESRIGFVDSLRAIAVLIVVFSHFGQLDAGALAPSLSFLRTYVSLNGHLGVTLFFVISGFVIPSSLLTYRSQNLARFVISRISRLYPAYWLSIGMAVLVLQTQVGLTEFVVNTTMTQRFFSFEDIQGVYWTLSVEMIFYFLTAVLFYFGLLGPGRQISLILVAAVALTTLAAVLRHWLSLPLPAGTMMYLCLMFLGAWLRLGSNGKHVWLVLFLFLSAMLACSWLLYYPAAFNTSWILEYAKFFLAVVIFIVAMRFAFIGSNVSLKYIGRISYSIYLFHMPLIAFAHQTVGVSNNLTLEFVVVSALFIIGFSSLTFFFVEQPFIQLGRFISRKF
jgi:peptidoglycan/LPS O-acetylase OafA/YrhL